jgi:PII-like signaling protein
VIVVIVDRPERIDAFLPELDELITKGLVVREHVEIVTCVGRDQP